MHEHEHPNALLTRTTGGFTVHATYAPLMDLAGIQVVSSEDSRWVSVPKERLADAFNHPALYLGPERCEALGLR